ncbi:Protein of unknown function [Caminicella sporogenes DSM 14501]|uniref:ECF transporter S component n=1 Tax=Caminicella sporogenes DSM 14501 TaxID=1121266 RepID=A0A1M6NJ51_9FIRM|nr:ECF transporter S component [Caminicella sporogenes]RKD22183.1 ECF transporter S component [Caminicella sporogenes]WIF95801.1 ECF transporter S component [Caminicella sporogenes]SHJ95778.1 Protein of unknown function [Caminicella sporogenes DSM 14501]
MSKTNELVKASLFLSLGLILPYAFHATGMAGPIFLPMHIPVLLCGFVLGERYGVMIGFITPFLNSFLTGMPPLYPVAISMGFELATYGFITGYLYKNKRVNVYISLIIAMIIGRFISGIANYLLLTLGGKVFVFKMFLMSAFIKSIWGILIQIVFIPIIIKAIEKRKVSVNE